jgi:hypothetical protein
MPCGPYRNGALTVMNATTTTCFMYLSSLYVLLALALAGVLGTVYASGLLTHAAADKGGN